MLKAIVRGKSSYLILNFVIPSFRPSYPIKITIGIKSTIGYTWLNRYMCDEDFSHCWNLVIVISTARIIFIGKNVICWKKQFIGNIITFMCIKRWISSSIHSIIEPRFVCTIWFLCHTILKRNKWWNIYIVTHTLKGIEFWIHYFIRYYSAFLNFLSSQISESAHTNSLRFCQITKFL